MKVYKLIALVLFLQLSASVYAQKPEEVDSMLLRNLLNVEFSFDGIGSNESFQTLSVSLCDAGVVEHDTVNANAVADLLLCSEIRGYIEKPNHYFENPTPRVDAELDLLMLTQGWRRYDIDSVVNKHYPTIQYDIEETQSITGRVERTLNKNPKDMKLLLLSPMTGFKESFDLGENNIFRITNLDFIDGTPFTVQATTKNGKTSFVQMKVDEDVFPEIHTKRRMARTQPVVLSDRKPAPVEFYNKSKLYDGIKEKYRELQLDDVTVIGHRRTWYNPLGMRPTKMLKEGDYFLENAGYSGNVVQRLGLILKGASRNAIGEVAKEEFGRYHAANNGRIVLYPAMVYIDGFKASQEEFLMMPSENISRIEVYHSGRGLGIPVDPSGKTDYVFVTTKQIAKIHNKTLSMESVKPLGYKLSCEFYNPKFESRVLTVPDYRTTYYWNPNLQASPNGKWSFDCLIPCMTKKALLTVEGVGEDGRIVSKTKTITMQ